jgi:hypothetical protein
MEKDMNKLKDALWSILQYGYLWGNPKHISRENWKVISEAYKELNDGNEFEPDTDEVAR